MQVHSPHMRPMRAEQVSFKEKRFTTAWNAGVGMRHVWHTDTGGS